MLGITDRLFSYAAGAACLALAVALFFTYTAKHNAERRADKAELTLSQEREAAATSLALLTKKARETEQSLTDKAAQIEGEKNAQITALDARAAALTRRLRDAAATSRLVSSTSAVAGNSEDQSSDNFPRFSEQAGASLVAEAERAEVVRIALLACYRQYDSVRDALSKSRNN